MSMKFTDYSEPTNTAPNLLAAWDEARDNEAAREEVVNQAAAELQALAMRITRAQHTIVSRDSAIQQLEGEKLLPSYEASTPTRWDHFKAAILP